MYISRTAETVTESQQDEIKHSTAEAHEALRTKPGFRWAMLLRSLEAPDQLAGVSMWLSPDQATAGGAGSADVDHAYDVATARGSMTPASHVAIVDWEVSRAADRFTNRWNAVYHAIEDHIGSRLLRDLDAPSKFAGLHAVTDEANLNPEALGAAITDAEGLDVRPIAIHRYEVLLLTEA
jgi:heme-degrading monooxygenase HmoA